MDKYPESMSVRDNVSRKSVQDNVSRKSCSLWQLERRKTIYQKTGLVRLHPKDSLVKNARLLLFNSTAGKDCPCWEEQNKIALCNDWL